MIGTGLEVEGLAVAYGGNVAVDNASLHAPPGRITGLIGPNGAGKTTLFNACCGIVRARQGQVRLEGRDLTRASTSARGRAGLGRTFQVMQLIGSMTARQNVELGVAARLAGVNPLRHLSCRGASRRAVAAAAESALDQCEVLHLADEQTSSLSTGQRRLVELARVAAGGFGVMLLDEPSSGLDEAETDRLGKVVKSIVREQGVGVLLVEHDMELVMGICGHIYVLDFGTMLFDGSPEQVRNHPAVRAAYLGEAVE